MKCFTLKYFKTPFLKYTMLFMHNNRYLPLTDLLIYFRNISRNISWNISRQKTSWNFTSSLVATGVRYINLVDIFFTLSRYEHVYYAADLQPHYASCPSVCPSVCLSPDVKIVKNCRTCLLTGRRRQSRRQLQTRPNPSLLRRSATEKTAAYHVGADIFLFVMSFSEFVLI